MEINDSTLYGGHKIDVSSYYSRQEQGAKLMGEDIPLPITLVSSRPVPRGTRNLGSTEIARFFPPVAHLVDPLLLPFFRHSKAILPHVTNS